MNSVFILFAQCLICCVFILNIYTIFFCVLVLSFYVKLFNWYKRFVYQISTTSNTLFIITTLLFYLYSLIHSNTENVLRDCHRNQMTFLE
jgi:uncharacterized membrane protein